MISCHLLSQYHPQCCLANRLNHLLIFVFLCTFHSTKSTCFFVSWNPLLKIPISFNIGRCLDPWPLADSYVLRCLHMHRGSLHLNHKLRWLAIHLPPCSGRSELEFYSFWKAMYLKFAIGLCFVGFYFPSLWMKLFTLLSSFHWTGLCCFGL